MSVKENGLHKGKQWLPGTVGKINLNATVLLKMLSLEKKNLLIFVWIKEST